MTTRAGQSNIDSPLVDVYQMAKDTGLTEDRIRRAIGQTNIAFRGEENLRTARAARNAYDNFVWFNSQKGDGSYLKSMTIEIMLKDSWKKLSREELARATTKEEFLKAFEDAPPEVREEEDVLKKATSFYKLDEGAGQVLQG